MGCPRGFDGVYIPHDSTPWAWRHASRRGVWLRYSAPEDLDNPDVAGWRINDGDMLFAYI